MRAHPFGAKDVARAFERDRQDGQPRLEGEREGRFGFIRSPQRQGRIGIEFPHRGRTLVKPIQPVKPTFANVELPCFYIGDLAESIAHANGIRTRTFSGFSCFLVDAMGSIRESGGRMDFAADVLTDLFTANVHGASGRSILQHVATNDTEESDGGIIYPALQFLFAETKVAEGRT